MPDRLPRIEGDPPNPVSFRTENYGAGTVFPRKSQPWGEFNYALAGVCEFDIQGVPYLSPPHYAIWLPPDTMHGARNQHDLRYVTVYVERALCADLPDKPTTLSISPLLKAILADFAARDITVPDTAEDLRLAQVLVDQIRLAPGVKTTCLSPTIRCSVPCSAHCRPIPATGTRSANGHARWARPNGPCRADARTTLASLSTNGVNDRSWLPRYR